MNKYNFQTYIDFGASKIRIGVFDYELPKNNLYNQIECISNFDKEKLNIDTSKNLINKLIQSSEKELNLHIKNITLMIDAPDVQSFDFSIKKNLDSKSSFFEDIKFLLQDARQLAQKNNEKKIIIHTIIEKIIIDDKIYNELPNNNINYKSIALELKFIYISEIFYNTIIKHFKLIHIEVDNILCSSYVKSSNSISKLILDFSISINLFSFFNETVFSILINFKGTLLTTKPILVIFSTKFFAEPSIIGTSSEFNSTTALSTPKTYIADIRCSIVDTLAPNSFEMVVHRFALTTLKTFGMIKLLFCKSVLLKIIPEFGDDGFIVILTFFPE